LVTVKRAIFWQITLLPTYALGLLGLTFACSYEAAHLGPHTTSFNQSLKAAAEKAQLLGSPRERVVSVLGPPDNVMDYWEATGADGKPSPGALHVVTYEYYPYPWILMSKFQVHTWGGVVRVLEMFDD
jgi:hypothetical protein